MYVLRTANADICQEIREVVKPNYIIWMVINKLQQIEWKIKSRCQT